MKSPASHQQHPVIRRYADHVNPAFVRVLGMLGYGRVFTRAKGMYLWDHEERQYLDFLAGFGTVNLGHNHERLITRLRDALAEDLPNVMHAGPTAPAGELAEQLAHYVPSLPIALFGNAGGEAIEEALKLARAATGRRTILYCDGGFHGMGLGTLSVMGHARMRLPFEPLVAECRSVPFGDLDALARALRKHKPAAFVLEPLQAEAGVVVPPPGYLAAASELCRQHGALFVLDEIQTGIGRTGLRFAFEHEPGLSPDVLVLGKALGGSIAPISVAMCRREHVERAYGSMRNFDLHGSTLAGNAFACHAALETLRIVDDEGLCARAARAGAHMKSLLRSRLGGHPYVRDIRGTGLLIGLELGPIDKSRIAALAQLPAEIGFQQVFGQWIAVRMLEHGVMCQPASQQWNVLKLEPPLIVEDAQIAKVVDSLVEVLDECRSLPSLAKDVALRYGQQMLDGWAFR